jgi:LysM domain-containing protein
MVNNCNKFDKIAQGESCQSLLDKHKLSLADFVKWNPSVGAGCNTLQAETFVCVGVVGGAGTPTTATQGTNGISTPLPTQGGMVNNCDRFNLVNTGDTCASIGARNGVKSSRIVEWNKSVGSTCTSLQAKVNVCVRTIGFKPATPVSCHTATDHKTWGDNKPTALSSVVNWCDGNASGDGSGGFATAQVKRGCYNTPFGENKIEFVARNDFGIGTSLTVAKCEEIMRASVNGCARGGTGTHEGWWFT